jgi:site-specific DNA-adenine methylase
MKVTCPFGRAGSKQRLASWIVHHASSIPHTKWGELFAGTCAVTLAKEPVEWEFLNDADRWIADFLRVARDDQLRTDLFTRLRFSAWDQTDFNNCCDITEGRIPAPEDVVERARALLVSNQQSFDKSGRTHSISDTSSGIPKWNRLPDIIQEFADRIRCCHVMSLDYSIALRKPPINDPCTLVYADPPYVGVEQRFYAVNKGPGFDHAAFRSALDSCDASMMVSYEDHPIVRELYQKSDGWEIQQRDVTRALANNGKPATELLLIRLSPWAAARSENRRSRKIMRPIFEESLC